LRRALQCTYGWSLDPLETVAVNDVELSIAAVPVSSSTMSTTSSPVSRQSLRNDDDVCQWMIHSRSATSVPVEVTRSYLDEVTRVRPTGSFVSDTGV